MTSSIHDQYHHVYMTNEPTYMYMTNFLTYMANDPSYMRQMTPPMSYMTTAHNSYGNQYYNMILVYIVEQNVSINYEW